jgi:hypothetical protein
MVNCTSNCFFDIVGGYLVKEIGSSATQSLLRYGGRPQSDV